MPRLNVSNISLARKCQILFGGAALSIIGVSLIIPGMRMNDLTLQRYVWVAKEATTVALLAIEPELRATDWTSAQEKLNHNWVRLLKLGGGEFPNSPPWLITVEAARAQAVAGARGFLTESITQMQADPQALYRFKFTEDDSGKRQVRLAMAIRASEGSDAPGSLRGLLEVRVPIDREPALLNVGVLAASLSFGALLALLVFYLITQKILLSPVRKLRRLAEQVTSGDMEVRSTIATGDEFEDLAKAFNEMLGHLLRSQDELHKINVSLDTRLGELAETNVSLFESNRLKSEFIANVSHELRTPLVSIIGFAELLAEFGDQPPGNMDRLKRYALNILTSGRMLLDIINDLLDLAKIEAGKLELHLSDINVEDLCSTLIDFVTPLADKAGLSLSSDIHPEIKPMSTDAGRLKQILYNLLSNAIKFTPREGAVTLKVAPTGEGYVTFAVIDTGPGISAEQQAIIFEKFQQLDASHTREYSGTGLGLAITRELSAMLGGKIEVQSEPDKGSTFIVTLPINCPERPRVPLINLT